jgi:D-alanine-D-alanine ligase
MTDPKRVAVLKGGRSLEREVSLRSGANVEAALRRLGHEVIPVDADPGLVRTLRAERPDVVFVAMHGKGGEDGTVQELLEILDIPYTGSGVQACARAMDKVTAKAMFANAGIPTPPSFAFGESAFRELGAADALTEIEARRSSSNRPSRVRRSAFRSRMRRATSRVHS